MYKILQKISSIIETYESGAFKDLHVMHRELTCNMYYLSQEQVKAHQEWNATYYNSK
jgi:alkyl hydroperoxide reductase subunit AhpC